MLSRWAELITMFHRWIGIPNLSMGYQMVFTVWRRWLERRNTTCPDDFQIADIIREPAMTSFAQSSVISMENFKSTWNIGFHHSLVTYGTGVTMVTQLQQSWAVIIVAKYHFNTAHMRSACSEQHYIKYCLWFYRSARMWLYNAQA